MPGSLGRLPDAFETAANGDDDADDTLTGSAANDRFLGLGGDDQPGGSDGVDSLVGDEGDDGFVIGLADGSDTIRGFEFAEAIDLSGTGIANFADLLTDGQTLASRGIEAAELSTNDFLFADDGDGAAGDDAGNADVLNADASDDLSDLSGIIDVTGFDDLDSDAGTALNLGDEAPTFQGIAAADLAAESFIFAEDGEIVIAGTDGDDILAGTEANDTFLVEPDSGNDTILGFQQDDLLDVSALGLASFEALEVADSDDGAVQFDDGASVTLDGVEAADLDAFDFLLDT
jgi:serralysin